MMACRFPFIRDDRGTAAAEMALVTPVLLTLMFGAFELGNYFLDEHVVTKAVRDGARYAARLPVTEYYAGNSCVAGDYAGSKLTAIQNVTRTGSVDGTAPSRLAYWISTYATPPSTSITISVTCKSAATYPGIYTTLIGDVPVVMVKADVKYRSLFQAVGFNATNIYLHAQAQSAVIGI